MLRKTIAFLSPYRALLADNPDERVRYHAARYTRDRDLLEKIMAKESETDDPVSSVSPVCGLGGNTHTPDRITDRLMRHRSFYVRMSVARRKGLSSGRLAVLAEDSSFLVRAGVAGNAGVRIGTLEKLRRDAHHFVRQCAAGNGKLSERSRLEMRLDPDPWVRVAAGGSYNPVPLFFRAY